MPLELLFVVDPLDELKAYKDTSVAMMREAACRGHAGLVLEDEQVAGLGRADLESSARCREIHEGVLLRGVVVHDALAAGAADQEADAESAEHGVAGRTLCLGLDLRILLVELLQRRVRGLQHFLLLCLVGGHSR